MAIYKGDLKLVGTGRDHGEKMGVSYAVVEIGDHELRNVQVSDLMDSYLRTAVGREIEMLVSYGNSPSRKRVLAVRIDGKTRKDNVGFYFTPLVLCGLITVFCLAKFWLVAAAFFGVLTFLSSIPIRELRSFS